MKVTNKEKFIKYLFIYKHLKFIKYETDIKDKELNIIVDALNIKNNYKRLKYIINETCDYIDNYYKDSNPCKFKNNKCICHRNLKKDYINGCCRKCKYQSNKGCTTKNIACKLFYCSQAELNVLKLNSKDIKILKLLNPIERYIVSNDYFCNINKVIFELYFWQFLTIFLILTQIIIVVIR